MGKSFDNDVAFISALAELVKEQDLAEIEVEREFGEDDELKVRVTRYYPSQGGVAAPAPVSVPVAAPASVSVPASAPAAAAPAPAEAGPAPTPAAADPAQHPGAVASPMVGTVYLSPDPGADNFVNIGDTVKEGQTLLIVEAMKTMNQIPSPASGVVKEVLVENEQPVEFGTPLIIIE